MSPVQEICTSLLSLKGQDSSAPSASKCLQEKLMEKITVKPSTFLGLSNITVNTVVKALRAIILINSTSRGNTSCNLNKKPVLRKKCVNDESDWLIIRLPLFTSWIES